MYINFTFKVPKIKIKIDNLIVLMAGARDGINVGCSIYLMVLCLSDVARFAHAHVQQRGGHLWVKRSNILSEGIIIYLLRMILVN